MSAMKKLMRERVVPFSFGIRRSAPRRACGLEESLGVEGRLLFA
jgi:hypothetical protein